MKNGSRTSVVIVWTIILGITQTPHPASSESDIQIQSIRLLPFRQQDHGKFIEVCFSRPLERRGRLYFEGRIETKDGKSVDNVDHNEIITNSFSTEPPIPCHRLNLFVYFVFRHSPPEVRNIVEKSVNPGNVRRLEFSIFGDRGFIMQERVLLDKKVFENL